MRQVLTHSIGTLSTTRADTAPITGQKTGAVAE